LSSSTGATGLDRILFPNFRDDATLGALLSNDFDLRFVFANLPLNSAPREPRNGRLGKKSKVEAGL
jgi:hypothetical protein